MQRSDKRVVWGTTLGVGVTLFAIGFVLSAPADEAVSWKPAAEGFLAVATPCCTQVSLWGALDEVTDDGQRARAALAEEAARWLNEWPYRSRDERDAPREWLLRAAMENSEVRCVDVPAGREVVPRGDDVTTLEEIRYAPGCTFIKWKVWSTKSEPKLPNERHTVWVDEDGLFHGRVDYWR